VGGRVRLAAGAARQGLLRAPGKRLRADPWGRLKHRVRRAYGLPFNDPRVAEWTEADWLREAAWLEIELEPPKDPDELEAEEEFDEEIEAAGEGRWEELGLDPPPAEGGTPGFVPASIDEFMDGEVEVDDEHAG
jgi:hypothetical protein